MFKAMLKYSRGRWRRIEIKGSQTLGDFDCIMREAFNHDTWDHLSEFYSGRVWRSEGFSEIEPGGGGSGSRKRIDQLGLAEGDRMEYVYDFGDDIQHIITLEEIVEPEEGVRYPRITGESKTRHRYCAMCKNQGKKTVAEWICIECSDMEGKQIWLCDGCLTKEHEDHYGDEIFY